MRLIYYWLAIALLPLTAGCRTTPSSSLGSAEIQPGPGESNGRRKVIYDNDMNLDDWPAFLFLLHNPAVEVVAVTVNGTGVATCNYGEGKLRGAEIALALLKLAGKEGDDIPVACGRSEPLSGSNHFPVEWRKNADTIFGLTLAPSERKPDDRMSEDVIIHMLERATEPLTILTTGSLTDVAAALRKQPKIAANIAEIVIMGGAVRTHGNLVVPGSHVTDNKAAEWNIYLDPVAADFVLNAGVHVRLVPLDGTNHVPVTLAFRDRLGLNENQCTASARFIHDYFMKNTEFINTGEFFFWDPLAAAAMTENVCQWERISLKVTTAGGNEQGRTAESTDDDGVEHQVCVKADGAAFQARFLAVVNSGPTRGKCSSP